MTGPQQALVPADVALSALDKMVAEYQAQRGAQDPRALLALREELSAGNVPAALNTLESLPELRQDRRLVFRLHKQQFVELMRTKYLSPEQKSNDLAEALACARSHLATCALDAYPDAYTEFKRALQLLVYVGNQGVNRKDWPAECQVLMSQSARNELAELVYQTGKQALGIKDCQLVRLLTYLLRLRQRNSHLTRSAPPAPARTVQPCPSLHPQQPPQQSQQQASQQPSQPPGSSSSAGLKRSSSETSSRECDLGMEEACRPGKRAAPSPTRSSSHTEKSDPAESLSLLCDQLLSPTLDHAPLPRDLHEPYVASFEEKDIQVLVRCLGCPRRDAIEALRRCGNQVTQAFQVELGRSQLNRSLLDELVDEYSAARGMQPPATAAAKADTQPQAPPTTTTTSPTGNDEESVTAAIDNVHIDEGRTQGQGVPAQGQHSSSHGTGATREPRSQGWASQQRSASQSPPTKQPCCRPQEGTGDDAMVTDEPASTYHLSQLPSIAKAEGPAAVHAAVASLAPGFWDAQPTLLFQLWSCEFSARIAASNAFGALELARSKLTPLANQHNPLQQQLKGVMAQLLPTQDAKGTPLSPAYPHTQPSAQANAGTSQSPAVAASGGKGQLPTLDEVVESVVCLLSNTQLAGGSDTRLVRLVKELLAVHRAWTRIEGARDPFQQELGIPSLRLAPPRSSSGVPTASTSTHGAAAGAGGRGPGGDPVHPAMQQDVQMEVVGGWWDVAHGAGSGGGAPLPGAQEGGYQVEEVEEVESSDEYHEGEEDGDGQEDDVARLAEVLNIPRDEAASLLAEYGDVEAAIYSRFG